VPETTKENLHMHQKAHLIGMVLLVEVPAGPGPAAVPGLVVEAPDLARQHLT